MCTADRFLRTSRALYDVDLPWGEENRGSLKKYGWNETNHLLFVYSLALRTLPKQGLQYNFEPWPRTNVVPQPMHRDNFL